MAGDSSVGSPKISVDIDNFEVFVLLIEVDVLREAW